MPKEKSAKTKPKPSSSSKLPKRVAKISNPPASKNSRIDGVFKITQYCFKAIKKNWPTFLVLIVIYFLVSLIFVQGLGSSIDIANLKQLFHSGYVHSSLATGLSTLFIIVGNSNSTNNQSFAQPLLLIVASLAMIWIIRGSANNRRVPLRDAVYKSLTPLIPFILMFLLMAVDLLPLILGSYLINVMFSNSLAPILIEQIAVIIIGVALIGLSVWLLIPSVFSLYIVTLPDMRPVQALRSAWGLVKNRRTLLLGKIIYIILFLLLVDVLITFLFVLLFSSVSGLIYFLISIICLLIFHSYMYNLYRELL